MDSYLQLAYPYLQLVYTYLQPLYSYLQTACSQFSTSIYASRFIDYTPRMWFSCLQFAIINALFITCIIIFTARNRKNDILGNKVMLLYFLSSFIFTTYLTQITEEAQIDEFMVYGVMVSVSYVTFWFISLVIGLREQNIENYILANSTTHVTTIIRSVVQLYLMGKITLV
jgi:hypothetical protein